MGALVVLALLPVVVTQTGWGRARLSEFLMPRLSRAIRGSASLGAVDEIGWGTLVLSQLVFHDPDGQSVLVVDHARVQYDPWALLTGSVDVASADIDGGLVEIEETTAGEVPLEVALSPARTGGSEPAGSNTGEGPRISLRNLRVENLAVVIDLQALDVMRAQDVAALVRIELHPSGRLGVRFANATGLLPSSPLGDDVKLREVDGRVRGSAEHVLELHAALQISDEEFGLHVNYYHRDETPVELRVTDLDLGLLALRIRTLAAGSELVSAVDVQVGDGDAGNQAPPP